MSGVFKWASITMVWAGALACFFMVTHVFLDAFTTYVFNMPVPGTLEVTSYYYMVGVVFLPLAYCEQKNLSIVVELFYDFSRPSIQRIMRIFGTIVSLVFFGILLYQTLLDAVLCFQRNEHVTGIWDIMVWPGRFFLPISFAMANLVLVERLIRDFVPHISIEK